MKKCLTLLILFLSQLAFAQSYIVHEKYSHYQAIAVDSEHGIATGGAGILSCDPARLTLFDQDAQPIWDELPHLQFMHPIDMIWDEGELVMVGYYGQFEDVVTQPPFWFFARYSPDGTPIQVEVMEGTLPENSRRILTSRNGGLLHVIATIEDVVFISTDGLINASNLNIPVTPQGVALMDGFFVTRGPNNIIVSSIEQLDPVWGSETQASPIEDMLVKDNVIWWVSKDFIYTVDELFNEPDQIPMPDDAHFNLQMEVLGDSLLVYETEKSGTARGWWVNTNTNVLSEAFAWELEDMKYYELKPISADSLWLVGILDEDPSTGNGSQLPQGFVAKTGLDAFDRTSLYDIGVSNLTVTQTGPAGVFEDGSIIFVNAGVEVNIEVTNYGAVAVDEFILSSQKFGGFNCSEGRNYHAINNADLAPGESKIWTYVFSAEATAVDMIPDIEVRFFTGAPNHQFDDNPGNDSRTEVIVQTENLLPEEEAVHLFPNPATDIVQITSGHPIQAITLFDVSGKAISKEESGESTSTVSLERGSLPAGVYWLRIQGDNRTVIRKLVWQ